MSDYDELLARADKRLAPGGFDHRLTDRLTDRFLIRDLAAALRATLAALAAQPQPTWPTKHVAAVPGSAIPACPVCDEPLTDEFICLGEKHDVAPRQVAGPVTLTGDDDERDARFAPGNDRLWGKGNWIRCSVCPHDQQGREVYHHKDAHSSPGTVLLRAGDDE